MKFSVIIPAYNSEKFIKRSVDSVINQSYSDFEVIVVNDGSTDDTVRELLKISDNRLRIINKDNGGVSSARNIGIKEAKGDYICFLDSDDEYLPNHLDVLNSAIDLFPQILIFSTLFSTKLLSEKISSPNSSGLLFQSNNAVRDVLFGKVRVWTGCICIKQCAFKQFGLFEEGIKYGEDRDMWERVYVHSPLLAINIITVQRNRDGSVATREYKRDLIEIDKAKRLKEYLDDDSISDNIKDSLITSYEWYRLSLARTHIAFGKKKDGIILYKSIDKKRIPFKRKIITLASILMPQFLLKAVLKKRHKDYYLA